MNITPNAFKVQVFSLAALMESDSRESRSSRNREENSFCEAFQKKFHPATENQYYYRK